jgi:phosphoribosylformylglycinamidine (FGAM) synthase-like amidotransferase family enzyme
MKRCIYVVLFASLLIFTGCKNRPKQEPISSDKINVAVFNGNGASATCVTETYEALKIDTGIQPSFISAAEIVSGKIDELDVIIFPGGSGSKELVNLGQTAAGKVLNFVKSGKGAVGICAGGYLFSTTKDYPSLRLVSATEWDREHYDKGRALVEFKLTGEGLKLFPELKNKNTFLQYYDGPVFMPADSGKSGVLDYIEYAKYVSDIAIHKNYPAGITPGKTFLLGEKVGNGRAIVVAGHPEATPGMRWMVPRLARWAANKKTVSYKSKWVRPEINTAKIFFTTDMVKKEKEMFWKLTSNSAEDKIAAMQSLFEMRSRPAVRWNLGMLRDSDSKVKTKAALLLKETEYTAAIPDLKSALKTETDSQVKAAIKDAIGFLSDF